MDGVSIGRRRVRLVVPALALAAAVLGLGAWQGVTPSPARAEAALARLPLSFVANRGQLDERVAFQVQGRDVAASFTRSGVTYLLAQRYAVKVDFVGARPVTPAGGQRLPGTVNVFKGNRSHWVSGIPTFRRVAYRNLWPGIDLVWTGQSSRLKYTLLVHPGADPSRIRLRYRGGRLSVDHGSLVVRTPVRTIREGRPVGSAPLAYQVRGDVVGFRVGSYDRSHTLTIDPPTLFYAGYLGGSGSDNSNGIAVDSAGSAYITGSTLSSDFPTSAGALQATKNPGSDAFVAKLNPAGSALVYSTYLGGNSTESGTGIAVDPSGNAYVTGDTSSTNFPTTAGAFQPARAGSQDAFVTKLSPAGSALVFSTYLGGTNVDIGWGIAVDQSGNAYLAGDTNSDDFPTTPGAFDTTHNGSNDAFAAKLNTAGTALLYSTYLGGSGVDRGYWVAIDSSGNAYLTGITASSAFPTTVGAYQTIKAGVQDAFATKLNPAGSGLVYSTYLGGSSDDIGNGIAVDSSGSAYLAGQTFSSNFPTTSGAFQTGFGTISDAFAAKLNPAGTGLVFSTYLGGSGTDIGWAVGVDSTGKVSITGQTTSSNFPIADAYQPANAGGQDAFVTKLNAAGSGLVYSTYLGGGGTDSSAYSAAIDSAGTVYLTGTTTSSNFPTTPGAYQTTNAGGQDAFVAKIGIPPTTPATGGGGSGVRITSGPGSVTGSSEATFEFTANGDPQFKCKLDTGSWDSCSSPLIYTGLAPGAHTFMLRVGADTLSFTWTITPPPARITICTVKPIVRADGTTGNFVDVQSTEYPTTDTTSPYYGATPAKYAQGKGLTCDNLPGYTDAGYKVDSTGRRTNDASALYEFWRPVSS